VVHPHGCSHLGDIGPDPIVTDPPSTPRVALGAGSYGRPLGPLDVGVTALGVIGDDGRGYELLRGLRRTGVDVAPLIQVADRFTPTYTKPMMREPDGRQHELQRLDIKPPAGSSVGFLLAVAETAEVAPSDR
jgi:bifunctional ADP-heptose synthase (sugar kinase/adenylyltransferase)